MSAYAKLFAATAPTRLVPVIVIETPEQALPMAKAFTRAGVTVLEITFRTAYGAEAIKTIKQAFPEMTIGAGTVLSSTHIQQALDAGSDFIVSPGTTPGLLKELAELDTAVFPGVATVSEAMTAYEYGFSHQKFFPAEAAGGVATLKSLHAPLPDLTFMPTGGITRENARSYLALENVACIGGSWMIDKAAIAAGDWERFEAEIKKRTAM
ncbi:MAG: bifunctional 4-hydroxy-2-oxoglutarate aldolase/2-dehydro-3-deoxy-phosphogluconate aldolase [Parvibaculales bacterium]